ncbi:MAG: 30S ribosomal protein S12 methylthiotransferase RimO [Dehalococcoidia bacterium]
MPGDIYPLDLLDAPPTPRHDSSASPLAPAVGSAAYHLVTLGCPKNVVDSESFEVIMQRAGHVPVDRPSAADLLVVNTCGFIDASKEESINAILELAAKKRPDQRLVVAGCLTQLYGDELSSEIPEIDNVFGVNRWGEVANLAGGGPRVAYDIPAEGHAGPRRVSAYLKISDGCNAPCTFCIIPTIKGRFTSVGGGELVQRARELVAEGARELVLVAQDSTAYGEDLGRRDALPDLLRLLAEAVPGPWLRIMYAYPGRVSKRLIAAMAEIPAVVPYLDMPLQHGSVPVLRRMRRPANMAMVRRTLGELREAMPEIALRTSLIVGFPGETEQEFEELLDFVRQVRFDHLGVFTYSPQERTPAATMPGQIPERVKRARRAAVMELQQGISLAKNRVLIGSELDVLVEAVTDGVTVGRSHRDAPEVDGAVHVHAPAQPGEIIRVRITDARPYDLIGVPARSDG